MDNSKKAIVTTFSLTLLLFSFIIFLLYIIYCYAYYDKYQEQIFIDNFNNKQYDFVYDKMIGKGSLTLEQLKNNMDNLTNKERLNTIFDIYYKDSGLYTKEVFMDTYLFNINNVTNEDITFGFNGKTNLFTRRAVFYDDVIVKSKKMSTKIGVFNKVTFKIEENSILRVDNKEIECIDMYCSIDKIYGGIYEINYVSNGYEYYGLVNINKDKQSIDITNLDSLVKVRELKISLKYGRYLLSGCNGFCPIINKSYLMINEDNTYYLYDYHKDGQNYSESGTYKLNGNNITLENKETFMITGTNLVESNNRVTYSYNG